MLLTKKKFTFFTVLCCLDINIRKKFPICLVYECFYIQMKQDMTGGEDSTVLLLSKDWGSLETKEGRLKEEAFWRKNRDKAFGEEEP